MTKDFALKRVYYDQIVSGRKTHEYRDLTNDYYVNTFLNVDAYKGKTAREVMNGLLDGSIRELKLKGITHLRFHNQGRMCVVEVRGISVDRKNRLWDIALGKVLSGKIKFTE